MVKKIIVILILFAVVSFSYVSTHANEEQTDYINSETLYAVGDNTNSEIKKDFSIGIYGLVVFQMHDEIRDSIITVFAEKIEGNNVTSVKEKTMIVKGNDNFVKFELDLQNPGTYRIGYETVTTSKYYTKKAYFAINGMTANVEKADKLLVDKKQCIVMGMLGTVKIEGQILLDPSESLPLEGLEIELFVAKASEPEVFYSEKILIKDKKPVSYSINVGPQSDYIIGYKTNSPKYLNNIFYRKDIAVPIMDLAEAVSVGTQNVEGIDIRLVKNSRDKENEIIQEVTEQTNIMINGKYTKLDKGIVVYEGVTMISINTLLSLFPEEITDYKISEDRFPGLVEESISFNIRDKKIQIASNHNQIYVNGRVLPLGLTVVKDNDDYYLPIGNAFDLLDRTIGFEYYTGLVTINDSANYRRVYETFKEADKAIDEVEKIEFEISSTHTRYQEELPDTKEVIDLKKSYKVDVINNNAYYKETTANNELLAETYIVNGKEYKKEATENGWTEQEEKNKHVEDILDILRINETMLKEGMHEESQDIDNVYFTGGTVHGICYYIFYDLILSSFEYPVILPEEVYTKIAIDKKTGKLSSIECRYKSIASQGNENVVFESTIIIDVSKSSYEEIIIPPEINTT